MANILFIDHTIHPSGAAISLGTLIRSLPESYHRFFILRKGSRVAELLNVGNHPCHTERWMPDFPTVVTSSKYSIFLWLWHFFKLILAFFILKRLCKKWKIDLIHLNETTLVGYALMARWLRLPVVLHARCPLNQRFLPNQLLHWASKHKSLTVIAIDEETQKTLPAGLKEKAVLIWNPVTLASPNPNQVSELRNQWGLTADDIAIGQIARLHDVKGIWEILSLAKNICPKYPQIKFVFVGDDRADVGDGPELKLAAQRAGIEKNVVFAGYIEQVANVYGALDICLCLFADQMHAVGRTIYEAALAARPMILCLEDGKASSTMMNGALGIICPPHDLSCLEDEILRLANDPAERKAIGEKARRAIGDRHDPIQVAEKVKAVYEKLLKR